MDGRETAKQFCLDFVLKRIQEEFRIYDRVSVCQCEHLGGEQCTCSQNGDVNESHGEDNATGVSAIAFERDEEDKTDINTSRDAALPATSTSHINASVFKVRYKKTMQIWRTHMLRRTPSGEDVYIKPNIRQSTIEEQAYDLRNPLVLVINNAHFKGIHLPRNGSDADIENVKRLLTIAKFTFRICENCDKNEMRRVFEETRDDPHLENYDGLMCFIMSHGSDKGVMTADHSYIQVDEITAMFSGDQCPHLGNKPKLFFIQACRGGVDDLGFDLKSRGCDTVADTELRQDDIPITLPSDMDILVAYSTTKGKSAYRQFMPNGDQKHLPSMGSWFISCLTQVLSVYSHQEDLLTMLTRVNKAMTELYTIKGFKQISCYLSMLTKKVYFPTIRNGEEQ